jgi:hypothetical protein
MNHSCRLDQATKYLGTVLNGVADGIQASITSTTSTVNAAIDSINSQIDNFNSNVPLVRRAVESLSYRGLSIPGTGITIPTPDIIPRISRISYVTISFDVATIRSFQVPDTLSTQLIALNSSIPTLDQLRGDLENIVGIPFRLLKSEMNTTFATIAIPNVTVPLPPMVDIEFCGGLDTGFIDELGKDLVTIAHVGIGILLAIAFVIFAVNGVLTWIRYKFTNRHVAAVKARWAAGDVFPHGAHDTKTVGLSEKGDASATPAKAATALTPEALLRLDNELSHSFAHKVLDIIDRIPILHLSPIAHDRLAWYLSYIFSPSALVCFLVGLFGILAICVQLIAIKPIQRKVDEQVAKTVQLVISSVGTKINATMGDASTTYATNVNAQLTTIDTTLNGQFFSWIGNATNVLNNTVVTYYADLETGINSAFGNTVLANPMLELVRCIVGNKIVALQGAVTFLQAHLRLPIPRVAPDVLLLSNHTLAQVSSPIADAAIGGANGGVFGRLVDRYLSILRSELVTFGIILGVWGFICLMGLAILFWDTLGKSVYAAYRNRGQPKEAMGTEKADAAAMVSSHPAWWQRLQMNRAASAAPTAGEEETEEGNERMHSMTVNTDTNTTPVPTPVTTPGLDGPTHALPIPPH